MSGERAISPVFAYTLTLGIVTLLVAGLVFTASGYVDDQREETIESEMQVFGQQLSADIAAVDRLSRTDRANGAAVERDLPQTTVGTTYTVTVRNDGEGPTEYYLELKSTRPEVTVHVGLTTQRPVEGRVDGGRVVVEYVSEEGRLEVSNADA